MQSAERRTKLWIPALAGFYEWARPYGYPLIRFIVGALIIPEGYFKIMSGFSATAAGFAREGFWFPAVVAFFVIMTETVGGFCVAIGLLTRFWAAAIALEMAVITFHVQWHNGYPRVAVFALWGIVAFAVALRGGGRCSVDRLIGREL